MANGPQLGVGREPARATAAGIGRRRTSRRLETLLAESVIFGDEYLDSVTTHLIYAGGKRLRPMLAIASATSGERQATREDLLGGVALELMHLASLYHDDVMDEAEIRRNVDSVNARYGNLIAIVAGDYLMARSAPSPRTSASRWPDCWRAPWRG